MPNWCKNEFWVTGDEALVKQFVTRAKGRETELVFNNFVPCPKEVEEADNSYGWHVNHWGTKWEPDVQYSDGAGFYVLDTAWSPPIAWLEKVVKLYPELQFTLKYDEPGMGFMGVASGVKGIVVDQSVYY